MTSHIRRSLWFSTLILALCCGNGLAKDYYVSPRGNDANPGTKGSPWRTIERLNSTKFQPGDRILFEGGQTFSGTLQLGSDDSGAPGNKVTVGSYGAGRAVINGGLGRAISMDGCNHVLVHDLKLVGAGRKSSNTESGLVMQDVDGIDVDQVEVTGFRRNGVEMYGVQNVRLTRVHAHQNGKDGINCSEMYGVENVRRTGPKRSRNIYVGYCLAENNPGDPTFVKGLSGSGIVLGETDGALIEYCEARFNGWDMGWREGNGPVGIWTYDSDKVIMQYNVSHHNRSTTGDGGGFDIDGGVTNSIMQYNYSHDNFGPGFLICPIGEKRFANNIVRYNISQDDGLKRGVAPIHIWVTGQDIGPTLIHNNTVFNSQGSAIDFGMPEVNNVKKFPTFLIYNNIFVSEGPQILYYCLSLSDSTGVKFSKAPKAVEEMGRFLGNLYWGLGGRGFRVGEYTDLNAWAAATGQEKIGDRIVGRFADPMLRQEGIGQSIDANKLASLFEYQLLPGSPAIDNGLNLKQLFNIDPGPRDYYGTPLPTDGKLDMGAHQFAVPNPAKPR